MLNAASVSGTRMYGHVAPDAKTGEMYHYVGYQNEATSLGFGELASNVMFLNFAGRDLELVRPALYVKRLMHDLTWRLPSLEPVYRRKGSSRGAVVMQYGGYTVVTANNPQEVVTVGLEHLADATQLTVDRLHAMAKFFADHKPNHTFVLAFFREGAQPKHPIVVRYRPHDPEHVTLPGLDAHDGSLPVIGGEVMRHFRIAYGVYGRDLEHKTRFHDAADLLDERWMPMRGVVGFYDNGWDIPNGDYIMPMGGIMANKTGPDLAELLVPDRS